MWSFPVRRTLKVGPREYLIHPIHRVGVCLRAHRYLRRRMLPGGGRNLVSRKVGAIRIDTMWRKGSLSTKAWMPAHRSLNVDELPIHAKMTPASLLRRRAVAVTRPCRVRCSCPPSLHMVWTMGSATRFCYSRHASCATWGAVVRMPELPVK